jgi:transposase
MIHYAGLDVSMNTTFICIDNEKGKVVEELEAVSTSESIDSFLSVMGLEIEKVGLENSCLNHYLKKALMKNVMKYLNRFS